MTLKIIHTAINIFAWTVMFAQGHIDHIKNQEYLKYKDKVDCSNHPGDNLSARICANLAFQKADSLLTIVYESFVSKTEKDYIDSFDNKIIQMQVTWRLFRDKHCAIIYDSYEGCGGCHLRAIDYLYCLTELTENRIEELKKLHDQIVGE